MTKCSVCQLPDEKRAAIDAALRDGAPLQAISDRTGVTKSSLWRHGRHMAPANGQKPEPTVAGEATARNSCAIAQIQSAPAAEPRTREKALRRLDPQVVRQQALERCELLWAESLDGLSAAKEEVTVMRADGSQVTLPGDLRARAAFLREARGVVDLDSRLAGLFDAPGGSLTVNVVALLLQPKDEPAGASDAIEISSQKEE